MLRILHLPVNACYYPYSPHHTVLSRRAHQQIDLSIQTSVLLYKTAVSENGPHVTIRQHHQVFSLCKRYTQTAQNLECIHEPWLRYAFIYLPRNKTNENHKDIRHTGNIIFAKKGDWGGCSEEDCRQENWSALDQIGGGEEDRKNYHQGCRQIIRKIEELPGYLS